MTKETILTVKIFMLQIICVAALWFAFDTNRDVNRFEQYRAQDNIDNLCLEFQIQKRAASSDAPLPEICSKFDR